MDNNLKAVILAAGKGTRLKSENNIPKVLRQALGRPLLAYVLDALDFIQKKDTIIVVGYEKEQVIDAFEGYEFAVQEQQLGTGHAVMSAAGKLEGCTGSVLVCCGDMPLIKKETYAALASVHEAEGNACTILTGTSDEPLPYGRIIRDENGAFVEMVEDRDCTPEQKAIDELNSGVYIFDIRKLLPALGKLRNANAQSEYYLTDVPAILRQEGEKIGICKLELGSQIIGVNTVEQLEKVEDILKNDR